MTKVTETKVSETTAIRAALRARTTPARAAGAIGYGSYDDTINALEVAVGAGPYILGDRFSAADVYIGSQIGFGVMTKGIEPRPVFQAYLARLGERPAYKRATNADNETMAKAQAK